MDHDAELVSRAQQGDSAAFEALVLRYQRLVYYLALEALGDHDSAADAAQEVFIRAYRGIAGFGRRSGFRTWLHRIALNVCRDHLRRSRREATCALERVGAAAGPVDVWEGLMQGERETWVRGAIRSLPPMQQGAIILRAFEGLPHREVARILGCSVGAARVHYHCAVRALRALRGDRREGGGR